jgi:hypothetical protein
MRGLKTKNYMGTWKGIWRATMEGGAAVLAIQESILLVSRFLNHHSWKHIKASLRHTTSNSRSWRRKYSGWEPTGRALFTRTVTHISTPQTSAHPHLPLVNCFIVILIKILSTNYRNNTTVA